VSADEVRLWRTIFDIARDLGWDTEEARGIADGTLDWLGREGLTVAEAVRR